MLCDLMCVLPVTTSIHSVIHTNALLQWASSTHLGATSRDLAQPEGNCANYLQKRRSTVDADATRDICSEQYSVCMTALCLPTCVPVYLCKLIHYTYAYGTITSIAFTPQKGCGTTSMFKSGPTFTATRQCASRSKRRSRAAKL